jgi:hypothetical protein
MATMIKDKKASSFTTVVSRIRSNIPINRYTIGIGLFV